MAYNPQILFGIITKVHGHEGAVTLRLEKAFIEQIPELESVFLEIEGKPVPFFISSVEYPGADQIWLKFDGYESLALVKEFVGCKVYLTLANGKEKQETRTINPQGYQIISEAGPEVGVVTGIIENPGQLLLSVKTTSGKEILIPFHEDLIRKADKKRKIIYMELPDGLIDLN